MSKLENKIPYNFYIYGKVILVENNDYEDWNIITDTIDKYLSKDEEIEKYPIYVTINGISTHTYTFYSYNNDNINKYYIIVLENELKDDIKTLNISFGIDINLKLENHDSKDEYSNKFNNYKNIVINELALFYKELVKRISDIHYYGYY